MKKFLIVAAIVAVLYYLYQRMQSKAKKALPPIAAPAELEPQIVVSPAADNPKIVNMHSLVGQTTVLLMQADNYSAPGPQNYIPGSTIV